MTGQYHVSIRTLPCDVCQRLGGLCDFHRKMGFPVKVRK